MDTSRVYGWNGGSAGGMMVIDVVPVGSFWWIGRMQCRYPSNKTLGHREITAN